jgi:hypothetical protein
MATDSTRLWPEIAADALDECNALREVLRGTLVALEFIAGEGRISPEGAIKLLGAITEIRGALK